MISSLFCQYSFYHFEMIVGGTKVTFYLIEERGRKIIFAREEVECYCFFLRSCVDGNMRFCNNSHVGYPYWLKLMV